MSENLRAKVFISCGQSKDTNEPKIARRIADRLSKLGFDPYVAVEEQTLRGVKENIFAQLQSAEYFVFVDFKRERLKTETGKKEHRGSVFCHQELAIASHLDIPVLALQEKGVRQLDGLLRFLQANVVPFSDRDTLANVIADKVQERGWEPNWKNRLTLTRCSTDYEDTNTTIGMCRFFQIDVTNLHKDKIAVNCYAYLQSANDLATRAAIPIETVEHKWRGHVFPNAAIMAQRSHRRFDAFFVPHDSPRELHFNVLTDSTRLIPRLPGRGPFELTYVVLSENFPEARGVFNLTLADDHGTISLVPVPPEGPDT
jgi:hypothetical protein